MSRVPEWLRSFLITFVVVLAGVVAASDFVWTKEAILAAVISAGRVALSGLLPGGSFGVSPKTNGEVYLEEV